MNATRRTALLGGSALILAGCDTLRDWGDSILGTTKVPLSGERVPVIAASQQGIGVDADAAGRRVELPTPQSNTTWLQPGGTPDHAPGHPALPRPIGQVWRTDIGSGNGYRQRLTAAPVLDENTAYAMDAFGWVSAIDLARGSRRWQTDTRPRRDRDGAMGGALALEGGTLYVATGLAEIMALDPANGTIKWRAPLASAARGGIVVGAGRIFVPNVANQVQALSTEDGRQLWAYSGRPVQALPLGLASPALVDDTVVCGMASGEITALRVNDGRQLWSESLATNNAAAASIADIGAITASPVIDRGRVFVVGMGGLTSALDLRSGRRVWEREVGGIQTPWSAGDWLFVLTRENRLLAMGRDDGRIRWLCSLPQFEDERRRRDPISWGPPVLAGGRLLLTGSHAQMFEVDAADGEIVARLRLPGGSELQPAIAQSSAYLLTDSGELVALRGVG
ncbi:outer membrane protein assembly factor BamB family protein [Rhodovarius crocodyli]|nr:PQQ-binding-like beta-propeller repeat protein [Rhodovarius crocodyli]